MECSSYVKFELTLVDLSTQQSLCGVRIDHYPHSHIIQAVEVEVIGTGKHTVYFPGWGHTCHHVYDIVVIAGLIASGSIPMCQ